MNIFVLAEDPSICAKFMVDKHVVKMILEYGQLLSTTHRVVDGQLVKINNKKHYALKDKRESILYKATHINHPCAIWARKCDGNYDWLLLAFDCLAYEYNYRYGKVHATYAKLRDCLINPPNDILHSTRITEFPQCMPDAYKVSGDYIKAYRNYYIKEKAHIAKWTKRNKPEWFVEN
jgi:hypothetical protein